MGLMDLLKKKKIDIECLINYRANVLNDLSEELRKLEYKLYTEDSNFECTSLEEVNLIRVYEYKPYIKLFANAYTNIYILETRKKAEKGIAFYFKLIYADNGEEMLNKDIKSFFNKQFDMTRISNFDKVIKACENYSGKIEEVK